MSKSNEKSSGISNAPTAPIAPPSDVMHYANRAPPPSYEESLRMQAVAGAAGGPPPFYPGPVPQYYATGYNYPPNYVAPTQQAQVIYPTYAPTVYQANDPNVKPVLHLAKGASVRTTANGAISIPPPPPGVAPTPAQLAAMNGQNVIVKTQKRGFF